MARCREKKAAVLIGMAARVACVSSASPPSIKHAPMPIGAAAIQYSSRGSTANAAAANAPVAATMATVSRPEQLTMMTQTHAACLHRQS